MTASAHSVQAGVTCWPLSFGFIDTAPPGERIPLTATRDAYMLGRDARALHAAGSAFHNEEPEHIKGTPRQVPHPHGGLNSIPIKGSAAKSENGSYRYRFGSGTDDHIRISSHGTHQELTAAHEIGHWIDNRALSSLEGMKPAEGDHRKGSMYASRVAVNGIRSPGGAVSMNPKLSGQQVTPAWTEWAEAVIDSEAIKTIFDLTKHPEKDATGSAKFNRGYLNYLLKAEEMWARSYAQYIANKSGNKAMLDGVDNLIRNAKSLTQHSQWSGGDFTRIEAAIDGILEEQGWRR